MVRYFRVGKQYKTTFLIRDIVHKLECVRVKHFPFASLPLLSNHRRPRRVPRSDVTLKFVWQTDKSLSQFPRINGDTFSITNFGRDIETPQYSRHSQK